MALGWGKNFWAELGQPGGWSLAVKSAAGVVAFAGGIITLVSFVQAHEAEQSNSIHARMESIQSGLLSTEEASRIAALRSLRMFARDPVVTRISNEELRDESQTFIRRSLIESVQSSKSSSSGDEGGPVNSASQRRLSPEERYEMLATFEEVGRTVFGPEKAQPAQRPVADDYSLDFMWASQSHSTDDNAFAGPASFALSGFNFDRLKLHKVRFDCLVLERAAFTSAAMEQVSFFAAKLENADFLESRLKYVTFTGSTLRAARFDRSEILGSAYAQRGSLGEDKMSKSCAAYPRLDLAPKTTIAIAASFKSAHIYETDFSGAELPASRFDSSQLSNVNFKGALLGGAAFDKVQISGSSFEHADLEGVSFLGAVLSTTNFDDANLKNASFMGVRFVDDKTTDSLARARDLQGANFSGVKGIAPERICGLLKAGAVLVENEHEWSRDGRQREIAVMSGFMSADDRQLLGRCGDAPP